MSKPLRPSSSRPPPPPPPSATPSTLSSHSVAAHYNARRDQGTRGRRHSPIFRLRAFNNWIKSVLIHLHISPNVASNGLKVLDMCCGKGGDLGKWARVGVRAYVGIDIAELSIEDARGRAKTTTRGGSGRGQAFDASFHVLDCFGEVLESTRDRLLLSPCNFNVVSMQFALHYAFESKQRVQTALRNVAFALRPGGVWIGTVPDANWIVSRLKQTPSTFSGDVEPPSNGEKGTDGLAFGNSVYRIVFEQRDRFPVYGHKYTFRLEDAIDDCAEYLVHFPTLVKLAAGHGLELVHATPFHTFYAEQKEKHEAATMLTRMGVIGGDGPEMSADEWEVAGAYLVFAFRKRIDGEIRRESIPSDKAVPEVSLKRERTAGDGFAGQQDGERKMLKAENRDEIVPKD